MITEPTASLLATTHGCKLVELDALNGGGSGVLVSPNGAALRISPSSAALIRACREGQSVHDIATQYGLEVEQVSAAMATLSTRIERALQVQLTRQVDGFLARRRFLPARIVQRLVDPLRGLCSLWVAIPAVIAATAICLLAVRAPAAPIPPMALWSGFAISLGVLFIHELGHGAACRAHGAAVGEIGVALYLIYPAFYCDVTHTWALPRRGRIAVDISGVYFQLLATALLVVAWQATGALPLLVAARMSMGTILVNLMPLGRFDGYWLLSDVLGVIDLRAQGRRVGHALYARLRGRPHAAMPWPTWVSLVIAGYAVATTWFLISIVRWMLPQVAVEVRLLPERLAGLRTAFEAGDWSEVLADAGRLVSSALICWIAFALTRGVARSLLRRVKAARAG